MLPRLMQQMQFVVEIDKLKQILRQTRITDNSRQENSAEHSWHIALMAMLLLEYAIVPVDLLQVIKMLLLHDLVEIDAGDTFCYDDRGNQSRVERERAAAERLFGLLPPDQAEEFYALWQEFEAQQTANAQFAAALDRLQPLLNNYQTQGYSWQRHGITRDRVLQRLATIQPIAPHLWQWGEQLLAEAVAQGYLADSPTKGASE